MLSRIFIFLLLTLFSKGLIAFNKQAVITSIAGNVCDSTKQLVINSISTTLLDSGFTIIEDHQFTSHAPPSRDHLKNLNQKCEDALVFIVSIDSTTENLKVSCTIYRTIEGVPLHQKSFKSKIDNSELQAQTISATQYLLRKDDSDVFEYEIIGEWTCHGTYPSRNPDGFTLKITFYKNHTWQSVANDESTDFGTWTFSLDKSIQLRFSENTIFSGKVNNKTSMNGTMKSVVDAAEGTWKMYR